MAPTVWLPDLLFAAVNVAVRHRRSVDTPFGSVEKAMVGGAAKTRIIQTVISVAITKTPSGVVREANDLIRCPGGAV